MLNKLLKYEFQATGRMFLPAYGVLIILAAVQRVMLEIGIYSSNNIVVNILAAIIPSAFASAMVAVCVITLVAMISRFRKNLLGREGYLMFTLPVSAAQLIWSKIIVSVVWSIGSLIAGLISSLIVFSQPQYINEFFNGFRGLLTEIHGLNAAHLILYGIEVFVMAACSVIAFILMVYLCLSIGQLVNKHRRLCSLGAFIGINIILNNVIAAIFAGLFRNVDLSAIEDLIHSMSSFGQIHFGLITAIIVMAVQAAVYFLFTRYILTNKLNLE